MEMTRQLRSTEKQSATTSTLKNELNRMNNIIANYEEQINDLKVMVNQGTAFERMNEDLSDPVLSLEEDNFMLQVVLREMEENIWKKSKWVKKRHNITCDTSTRLW
jgi:chromosome segregation ATPase